MIDKPLIDLRDNNAKVLMKKRVEMVSKSPEAKSSQDHEPMNSVSRPLGWTSRNPRMILRDVKKQATGVASEIGMWKAIGLVLVTALITSGCSRKPEERQPPASAPKVDLQKQMDEEFQAKVAANRTAVDQAIKNLPASEDVSGSGETEAPLKAKVLESLRDPGSAQFKNLKLINAGEALCGELNAKNSYGGYVGFAPFVADGEGVYHFKSQKEDMITYALWYQRAKRYGCEGKE